MALSYELARRHYQIQRSLELEPGTRAFEQIAHFLRDLPSEALVQLLEHSPETHRQLVPLCLLAKRLGDLSPERLNSAVLKPALEELFREFSHPLIQQLERLLHDEKLSRYPFVRSLLLQELSFHRRYAPRGPVGNIDRDLFRQYLSGYVYLLRSGLGNPLLVEAWNEADWLRRWQLDSTPVRQILPIQNSLRGQIAKYKLPEQAKVLYTELDQALAQPDVFLAQLEPAVMTYLADCPVRINDRFESRVRDLVQVVMRHATKKGFRIETLSQQLLIDVYQACSPMSAHAGGLLVYTVIQELILATQNLKYRLSDSLNGVARGLAELQEIDAQGAQERLHWTRHALLDGVMEIYESFTLADNALKAFTDHYTQACGERRHQHYENLSGRLAALFAG